CSFFFSSRRRHTRWPRDWSSDVCSSDLNGLEVYYELPPLVAASRERAVLVPLAARQFVVDLEAVAVGVREVDADGNRVIGDANGDALVAQASIDLREVVEGLHPPGDVIQTDLALLRPGGVVADLEERDVVG